MDSAALHCTAPPGYWAPIKTPTQISDDIRDESNSFSTPSITPGYFSCYMHAGVYDNLSGFAEGGLGSYVQGSTLLLGWVGDGGVGA